MVGNRDYGYAIFSNWTKDIRHILQTGNCHVDDLFRKVNTLMSTKAAFSPLVMKSDPEYELSRKTILTLQGKSNQPGQIRISFRFHYLN